MKYFYIYTLILFTSLLNLNAQDQWIKEGDNHFKQLNTDKALQAYSKHIELNPADAIAYIKRSKVYEFTGRSQEAIQDRQMAQSINPYVLKHVDPIYRTQLLSKKPFKYDSENNLGFKKSPARLEDYLTSIRKIDQNLSYDSLVVTIIKYLNDQNIDAARNSIAAISINKNNASIIYDLDGLINFQEGNISTALDQFTAAIESEPYFSIPYHNRAICFKLLGQLENAETDLETAIGLDDNISIYYFSLAKLYELQGKKLKAKETYAQAINLEEDYYEALTNYGLLLKGLGEIDEGIELLYNLIAKDYDKVENLFLKGNMHFIYGNYDEAINNFDDYLDIYQDDHDALFNRGLSEILLQNQDEGCKDIRSSLDIEYIPSRVRIHDSLCTSAYNGL